MEFLALYVIELHGKQEKTEPELRFINKTHIMQIWQDGEDIILELSDYVKLKIRNENIHVLMDRFI
jgi:hypothetical protein